MCTQPDRPRLLNAGRPMRGGLESSSPGRLGDRSRSGALTRGVPVILAVAGLSLLVLGLVMLFAWEISLFRFSTFDGDFTGLRCAAPLDNPGWRTGSPCHGAVNRQTGAAWVTTLAGVICLVAAPALARAQR